MVRCPTLSDSTSRCEVRKCGPALCARYRQRAQLAGADVLDGRGQEIKHDLHSPAIRSARASSPSTAAWRLVFVTRCFRQTVPLSTSSRGRAEYQCAKGNHALHLKQETTMFGRKSMIALAALTTVATAALSPASASAHWGGGSHGGFGNHGGFENYGNYG